MDSTTDLDHLVAWPAVLGYLNYSQGKPDPRFAKQLSDAYGFLAEHGAAEPWKELYQVLANQLSRLQADGGSAFRDVSQAQAVLDLAFLKLLPAYQRHHADLLFHQSAAFLFQPFFLVRVLEAVLAQGAPWDEEDRVVTAALAQLNDFVGQRPVAILETRPRGEPYDHERVRPIPLYIRGAGAAWGPYQALVTQALEILRATDPNLLAEAYFDPELLDELALDPRAYDHAHPVNRRPNYVFGEWDPHHIDNQGRYRRYVVRQVTLDALLHRVANPGPLDKKELLFEAAAVFAGTLLMATGVSGAGPQTHDSSVTLSTLMPVIARYRDSFYAHLLETVGGAHGQRLREEAKTLRQPFGGARQHLNQYLARHRARQLQQRHLSLLFAEMGHPETARREAARIPTVSARLLCEMLGRLTSGRLHAECGELEQAARLLPEVEELLRRGIACGALIDPWNILAFQGLFPLFASREDSIGDPRTEELILVVERTLQLYARLLSEAAGTGRKDLVASLRPKLRRFADWWDRFATNEVNEVRTVVGRAAAASAEHVAAALGSWHERGEAAADLAFWRDHLEGFRTPEAFAQVLDALLHKGDYRAAMALLMNWLNQAEQVPLEEGGHSFHTLALRWMLGVTAGVEGERTEGREPTSAPSCSLPPDASSQPRDSWLLIRKFFDYLEANAEDYWQVPELEAGERSAVQAEDDNPYKAAFEGVTYRDSTADGKEGAVIDGSGQRLEFDLEVEGERLGKRLRFLSTVARLWQAAVRQVAASKKAERTEVLRGWLATARHNHGKLLELLDAIGAHPVPEPMGSRESLIEYDRRRVLKEQLLHTAISTCLDTALAAGTLRGVLGDAAGPEATGERPKWEEAGMELEQALVRGDVAAARAVLPRFLNDFQHEPLLFPSLADGGQPRQILRARMAQTVLRALAANLPRLGLLRETYHLLKTARAMEQAHPPAGRGVTEFNQLFETAFEAVIEAVVEAASEDGAAAADDRELVVLLEQLTGPFVTVWVQHSRTLRLSALEDVRLEADWQALRAFIQRYGRDLFQPRFLTPGNLRALLHRGVGPYLDYLVENPDPLHPVRLVEELDIKISRAEAEQRLRQVAQIVVENYEEYKDYNSTTAHSDYGDNLHLLLEFLRLKAAYERQAWQFRPLVLVHEGLARAYRFRGAVLWQQAFGRLAGPPAERFLGELARLEQAHGMRLQTVRDRLEERFVGALVVDRLCALIEPAMEEAEEGERGNAFRRLVQELQPLAERPTGVGLDVPQWLRRLEAEARQVRQEQAPLAALVEELFQVPRVGLTADAIRRQLEEWEKPL